MRTILVGFILFYSLLVLTTAYAVNKCVDAKGTITYTDRACSVAATAKTVTIRIHTPDDLDTALANQRLDRYRDKFNETKDRRYKRIQQRAENARIKQINQKQAKEIAKRERRACERYTARYAKWENKKRAGYTISEGKYYDEQMAYYQKYMDQYCH